MNIRVKMEKLVFGGQCLGRLDNKVVFAWNALPGEEVELEITKNKRNFVEGIAKKIITPSPHRIAPLEDHFLICSPWQIISWAEENNWKIKIAEEAYQKIGGIPSGKLEIEHSLQEEYYYRNKIEYSFIVDKQGKISLAFFERGQHRHFGITECKLAEEEINISAKNILAWINEQKIPLKNLKSLIIRSNYQKQTIAALFLKDHLNFPKHPQLSANFLGFHIYYSNPLSPASIPDEILYTAGQNYLIANLKNTQLKFGLLSFFQVNIPIFEKALEDITKFLDRDKTIVDYYSGVGAISLPLSPYYKEALLIENNKEAVEYAQENISLNGLDKKFRTELSSAENMTEAITNDKIIIFDPPRTGLHEDVVKKILAEKPIRIIYLSCNPATQARDIKMFSSDYKISFLKLYNFFPRTPHLESLCVLERIY